MTIKRSLLLILVGATLMACTSTEVGTPSQIAPDSPLTALPTRPRELPLDDVDPCSVLAPGRQSELGVEVGRPGVSSDGFNSPACAWARFPEEPQDAYVIRLVSGQGAEALLRSVTEVRVVNVSGFAAVETQSIDAPPNSHCLLAIDVAIRQNLLVVYDYDGSTVPMTKQLACDKAKVAAEMAVETLIEQAGG